MNLTEAGNSITTPHIQSEQKAVAKGVREILTAFDGQKVASHNKNVSAAFDGTHIVLTFKNASFALGSQIEGAIKADSYCKRYLEGEGEWSQDEGLTLRFRPHEHVRTSEQEYVGAAL
jgi:hypothetical protein